MTKVHIERYDIASGHVLFRTATERLPLEQRPALLEASLLQWLKQNPTLRVTATLPITSHGHTVAIHIWFD